MRLRSLIGEIGAKYDRQLPMSSEAQTLLRQAPVEFQQWIPAGYRAESSGGRGRPAITPSIAVLAATETARSGLFVAYLFAADMSTVTLSLSQGISEVAAHVGRARARRILAWEAAEIRAIVKARDAADLDTTFDLRSTSALATDYQRANVLSRTYRLNALPNDKTMVADLQRFIRLYAMALAVRALGGQPGERAGTTSVRRVAQAKDAAKPRRTAVRPRQSAAEPTGPKRRGDEHRQGPARWAQRPIARRGLLAGLMALPVAILAPSSRGPHGVAAEENDAPPPLAPAPQFTIDVSQHDWDHGGGNLDWAAVRQAGIAGMCARATYGDPSGFSYPSYHFGDFVGAARAAGFVMRGGYHNLVRGDQASINRQVDWLRQELDAHHANWALLDVERYEELVSADAWPRWDDVRRFDDRWAAVDDRILVGYIPPWNWNNYLGQPDLREFRGPLISSNYPLDGGDDYHQLYALSGGDDGPGWAPYGNRVPEGWQFSSRVGVPGAASPCDLNAWRISSHQLYTLLVGDRP